MGGKLFIISVPIGNHKDITLRALETFKKLDCLLCESIKETEILFKKIKFELPGDVREYNEHTTETEVNEFIELLCKGKKVGLISDHGTPLIDDPGYLLLEKCHEKNIDISPVSGISSITAALSVSGTKLNKFLYCGLLPRDKNKKLKYLRFTKQFNFSKVIIDTPYRLIQTLNSVKEIYGKNKIVVLSLQLTMENELILKDKLINVINELNNRKIKKQEFVLVLT